MKANSMQYDLSTEKKPAYRTRGLINLLRMGHCAPAVMQTVLDINHTEQEWLVKLMAGMPGGIGNTGFECGAITSPLVILGLRHGLTEMRDGLPLIFDQGHAYYQRFLTKTPPHSARIFRSLVASRSAASIVSAIRQNFLPKPSPATTSMLFLLNKGKLIPTCTPT